MSVTTILRERFAASMMPNYGVPEIVLEHGNGCTVHDVDGKAYLDLVAGIAVSALGHNHPALVAAVTRQITTIAHTSNLYIHPTEVELAERLLHLLGADGKVFFANSGTEANECAVKLAITHARATGRRYLVAARDGFHGRSLGALALTGKDAIREPFGPYGIDVRFVDYGDAAALSAAVTDECAAVFVEPIQGEAGVVPPPDGYLAAVREVCDATGALFVVDEIQSGIGRTGAWFAHQHAGVLPDIVTVAKGLAGGLPIGACIGVGRYGDLFDKGAHGSTFGGNPVACAAALAVLDTVADEGLLAAAVELGDHLAAGIVGLGHPAVTGVRGRGLWRGITLAADIATGVAEALRGAGFLVNPVRPDVIRLAPPLVVSRTELDSFLFALPAALDAAYPPGGRS